MCRRGQRLRHPVAADSAAHLCGVLASLSHRYVRRRFYVFGARVMNRCLFVLLCALGSSVAFSIAGNSSVHAEDFGLNAPVAYPSFGAKNLGTSKLEATKIEATKFGGMKLTAKFPAMSVSPTTTAVTTTSLLASTNFDGARSSTFHSAVNMPSLASGAFGGSSSLGANNSLLRPAVGTAPVTTNLLGHSDSTTSHLQSSSLLQSGMSPGQSQMLLTPTTSFERRY
jgi:hypothetical protein